MIRAELAKFLTVRGTYVAWAGALAVSLALRSFSGVDGYPALVAGFACAHLLGSEYASGAIAITYTAVPARGRVLWATAAASAIVGAVWGLTCGLALGAPLLGEIAVTIGFALAGTGAAALTRRPGAASGLLGAVYGVAAGLLGATSSLGPWNRYGLGAVQQDALDAGLHALAYAGTLAYALAFLAIGIAVARRTDV